MEERRAWRESWKSFRKTTEVRKGIIGMGTLRKGFRRGRSLVRLLFAFPPLPPRSDAELRSPRPRLHHRPFFSRRRRRPLPRGRRKLLDDPTSSETSLVRLFAGEDAPPSFFLLLLQQQNPLHRPRTRPRRLLRPRHRRRSRSVLFPFGVVPRKSGVEETTPSA